MDEIPKDIWSTAGAVIVRHAAGYTDRGNLQRLIAEAIFAERKRSQWQPIETAPRDGSSILGVDTHDGFNLFHVCWWSWEDPDGTQVYFDGDVRCDITHWMPLPDPPLKTG